MREMARRWCGTLECKEKAYVTNRGNRRATQGKGNVKASVASTFGSINDALDLQDRDAA